MTVNPATGEVTGLEPHEVVQRLDQKASELDNLSEALSDIRQRLDPIEIEYDAEVEKLVAQLWDDYLAGKVTRWPGEDVRRALAHRDMNPKLRGDYVRLKADERHTIDAIERAENVVSAFQSILKAQRMGIV